MAEQALDYTGTMQWKHGSTWYRVIGDLKSKMTPTVVIHGGHNTVFYDLGPGDFDSFTEHQRYQPRAVYLLNNQWVQIQLGVYVIEYTKNDGVAYSHYSLNYGIIYHIYMETELTTNRESNQNILVDLFKETEKFLHDSIVNGSAPYFSNFRIK